MITKYTKVLLLVLMIVTSFLVYNVKAEGLSIDNGIGIEKRFADSGLSTCDSILGDVNDEKSVAWLVQRLLNYLKILGPTIAVVLGSLDFGKAIISSDEESMKKAQSKFIKRIIAAVALFFVPLFTQILLGMFGITSDNASCGLD